MSASKQSSDYAGEYVPRIHLATVSAVDTLGAGIVRVTLAGDDMHDYPTTGIGDEYVRLFFPDTPDAEVRKPFITEGGWDFEEGQEPAEMRTYTIRKHRRGEVDIDFVVHEGGIAAAWAMQARPGQQIALNPPRGLYERPHWARRQILVADEPALPAALRIAELTADDVETLVVAEVRGADYQLCAEGVAEDRLSYVWLRGTGNGNAPSGLLDALKRQSIDESTYVWIAGEAALTREIRGYLRHELKFGKDAYTSVGYWRVHAEEFRAKYDALGEEFHARLRELWASEGDSEEIVDEVNQLFADAGL